MFPLVMLVVNVSSVAVIWFGGHRVDDGADAGRRADRVPQLPDADPDVGDDGDLHADAWCRARRSAPTGSPRCSTPSHRSSPPADAGHATWRCTAQLEPRRTSTFTYPGAEQPVLSRRLASAPRPGQTIAVIGSTGAGKSTLVNLVPRLFDATAGTVRVDGVDVRDLDPDVLWARIGLVPQQGVPVHRHGRQQPAARQAGRDRRRAVGARSRSPRRATSSSAMPEGLDAPIVQGGTNVSGGQRQRLAIARALVTPPGIYLFDDSFSALDLATDARLRAALQPETRDATVRRRGPARLHDPRRRPDPRARGRRGRRPRHPRRAARRHPDLPGDRRLPAHRGGGGMSTTTPRHDRSNGDDARPHDRQHRADRGAQGGPGRGPMGGGMVGQKAMDFGPSAKRLVRRMRPSASRRSPSSCSPSSASRCWSSARGSSATPPTWSSPASSAGSSRRDPARRRGSPGDAVAAGAWTSCPARASTSARVGAVLLLVLAVYVAASLLAWLAGLPAQRRRAGHRAPDARGRRGQDQPRCRCSYFDQQPRGELLSRVTNDIDNVSQTLQQTMSQLLTSLLTVVGVLVDDVLDLAAAGADRAGHRAARRCSSPRGS